MHFNDKVKIKNLSLGVAIYFSLILFSICFYILFYLTNGYFPKSTGMPLLVMFIGSEVVVLLTEISK